MALEINAAALLLKMRGRAAPQQEAVRAALQRVMTGSSYVTVRSFGTTSAIARWKSGITVSRSPPAIGWRE